MTVFPAVLVEKGMGYLVFSKSSVSDYEFGKDRYQIKGTLEELHEWFQSMEAFTDVEEDEEDE